VIVYYSKNSIVSDNYAEGMLNDFIRAKDIENYTKYCLEVLDNELLKHVKTLARKSKKTKQPPAKAGGFE